MTTITHGFDGLADGAAVTTSSYGTGTAPNAVLGSVTADAARAVHGDMAAEMAVAGTTTAGLQDTTSLGTQTVIRGRGYLYISAGPAANLRIFQVLDGTTLACSVGLNTSRQVRLVDSAFAVMGTSGTAVPTGQVVRVEWRFVASATVGQASVKIWFSPESTGAPDITLSSGSTFNTRTSFSRYDSGISFSTGQTYTLFLDEIAWTDDDSGEIGPYVPPAPGDQELVDDFETGSVGAWDIATNANVGTGFARQGVYGVRLDSTTSFARLRWDSSTFGATRRWCAVRFWVRFPQGAPTEDVALVRWRNTDPLSSGGGGNGDVWLDSADQTLRGDLQPGDFFLGPALTANVWYQLSAVCAYKDDGTSSMKIRLNGTQIADVASTINDPGQTLAHVEFGTLTVQDDILDLDSITILVSDTVLDYLDDFGTGTLAGTAPAATGSMATAVGVAGTLAGTAPAAQGSATGSITAAGQIAGVAPAAIGEFTGAAAVQAELSGTAPAATASMTGVASVTAQLAGVAPAAVADFAGTVDAVEADLAGVAPAAVGSMTVALTATAQLTGQAPAAQGSFTATTEGAAGVLAGIAPTATGAFTGAASITSDLAGVAPAAEGSFVGDVDALTATLAGLAPAAIGSFDAAVVARAELAGLAPAATGSFTGQTETTGGVLAGIAPAAQGAFTAAAQIAGQVAGLAPAAVGAFQGEAVASGALAGVAPAATGSMTGQMLAPTGILAGVAPAAVGSFTGTSSGVTEPDLDSLAVGPPYFDWPVGPVRVGSP